MGVTLDQILMLTGRLDESNGFDSARERFRRFLLDHVHEPATARVLLDECQHAPGDQHRRALHDLVVLVGRFLGFHARFPVAGRPGEWQSPALHVLVDVRSDGTAGVDLTAFSAEVAASAAAAPDTRVVGLAVVTPMFVGRSALEASPTTPGGPVAVVSLSALLSVAALATARRATHDDVVRLLTASAPLGFVMQLLERCADERTLLAADALGGRVTTTGFWILRIAESRGTTADEFIEVIVGKRHILGLSGDRAVNDAVQPGDRVCFAIADRGVVGHGRVTALDPTQPGIRDAHRFRHLWRVEDVRLYLATPLAVDLETELRLRAVGEAGRDGQTMVAISRESFDVMTAAASPTGSQMTEGAPRLAG